MLSHRSWTPDSILRLLLGFFATIACVGLLAYLADWLASLAFPAETRRFFVSTGATLVIQGMILWLISEFLRENQTTWKLAFGLDSPRRGRALAGALAGFVVAFPVCLMLVYLSQRLMQIGSVTPVVQPAVQTMRSSSSVEQKFLIGLLAILTAPVVEELFFRGILYPAIKQVGYPRLALWGTSLIFAATHANLMTFVPLTFLALVLAALYEHTDNLLAPIVTHCLFNSANFIWLLLEQSGR